jgi:hypothetical protein
MNEAAADVGSAEIFSVDVGDRARSHKDLGWGALTKGPVGTVRVVTLGILAEHGFEVAPSEDEDPIEALSPDGAHEPFGDGVRQRRPDRGLDDPDALCGEDGVEGSDELGIPVRDEDLTRLPAPRVPCRGCGPAGSPSRRQDWRSRRRFRTTRVSWWMKKST